MTRSLRSGRQPRVLAVRAGLAIAVLITGCSGGDGSAEPADVFESERSRPTDSSEHDHSADASALAPRTVLPGDIAELGDGIAPGESMDLWLGLNVCGRFVDLPVMTDADASPGATTMAVDPTGRLTVSAGPEGPSGHEVTLGAVSEILDLELATGRLDFGDEWAGRSVGEGDEAMQLGGASLATGGECGLGPESEPAEVQLWYYTPAAVASGEEVRMVVTDPERTPLLEGGSAVTIAFAPVSSLPTLPPAALVG